MPVVPAGFLLPTKLTDDGTAALSEVLRVAPRTSSRSGWSSPAGVRFLWALRQSGTRPACSAHRRPKRAVSRRVRAANAGAWRRVDGMGAACRQRGAAYSSPLARLQDTKSTCATAFLKASRDRHHRSLGLPEYNQRRDRERGDAVLTIIHAFHIWSSSAQLLKPEAEAPETWKSGMDYSTASKDGCIRNRKESQ
ncbi:hypothetical protein GUJ93_ZPchr0006g43490 [Zizania palustris]|uniref:Uncharacterized protein n=1 Tax=Zizania palustris TaxID=103762 RepID=A0A8J5TDG7_ZIZPA|nr:hypothetical protein GUJ93_ZPchr0006g43490 [Zizania palustris]